MRNVYKAIPFFFFVCFFFHPFLIVVTEQLGSMRAGDQGDAERPALGRIFLSDPSGTVPRNSLWISVF